MTHCILLTMAISFVSASDDSAPENQVLASPNLLDSGDFFVCESKVPGMNGHYVLQSPDTVQSDPDTPVFFREDDDKDEESTEKTDFRLFRHNGFWMIADVEPWPPVTHFRCDPTKTQVVGIDVTEVCGMGQSTPPRIGYSPADPKLRDFSLTLHRQDCGDLQKIDTTDATQSSENNFSTKEEL